MKTIAVGVVCLLLSAVYTDAQVLVPVGPPGFLLPGPRPGRFFPGRPPFFGGRPPFIGGRPPFIGGRPPFFPGRGPFFGPPPPAFGPRFGQGRGLAYIGALGLLGLGNPIGAIAGAAGLAGLLSSDIRRF